MDYSFTFFFLFQSNKPPEECATWCNKTANCYGFVAVEERPGENSCWLKYKLRHPPNAIIESILSYYRLPGEYIIKKYKRSDYLMDECA